MKHAYLHTYGSALSARDITLAQYSKYFYSFVWFHLLVACGLLTSTKYTIPALNYYPSSMVMKIWFVEFLARKSFAFVFYNSMTETQLVDKRIDRSTARKWHPFRYKCWHRNSFNRCSISIAEWTTGMMRQGKRVRERESESHGDEKNRYACSIEYVCRMLLVLGYWINFNFIALQFNSNLFTVPLGGLPNCHRLQWFPHSSTTFIKWWVTCWCARWITSDHVPKCSPKEIYFCTISHGNKSEHTAFFWL